jgi:serine/threonine-protein kinase
MGPIRAGRSKAVPDTCTARGLRRSEAVLGMVRSALGFSGDCVVDQLSGTLVAERYRLVRLLGEGGMGFVWSATHEITGGRVALKFLKAANVPRAEARKRFLREARASALVDHPNVVQIRDVVEHEEMPVLVMDLLHGETLAARIQRLGRLDLDDAARIGVQIVAAVGAAHAAGLIHRDLKPENVFLARVPGAGEVVRILDFGIAKLMDDGSDPSTVTQSGALMGTPAYMAPEQVFGEKEFDHRVDIWAFGVILYESLAGVRPIDGENYGQIALKLAKEPLHPIRDLRPELPDDVVALLDRLLARDPAERASDLHSAADVLAPYARTRAPSFGPPRPRSISERQPDSGASRLFEPGARAFDPAGSTLAEGTGPRLPTTSPNAVSLRSTLRGPRQVALALGLVLLVVSAITVGVRSIMGQGAASAHPVGSSSSPAPSISGPAPSSVASVRSAVFAQASASSPSAPATASASDRPHDNIAETPTARPLGTASTRRRPSASTTGAATATATASATTVVEAPTTTSTSTGGLVTKPPF